VRIIKLDAALLELWKQSHLWAKFGWWVEHEVMARQILNAHVAFALARQDRVRDA
jgi:hypothetical protein